MLNVIQYSRMDEVKFVWDSLSEVIMICFNKPYITSSFLKAVSTCFAWSILEYFVSYLLDMPIPHYQHAKLGYKQHISDMHVSMSSTVFNPKAVFHKFYLTHSWTLCLKCKVSYFYSGLLRRKEMLVLCFWWNGSFQPRRSGESLI